MEVRPLSTNERAETPGFTHVARITADDLTQASNNTAQTLKICDLKIGDVIGRVQDWVKTQFQKTGDTAFNSTTRSLGDNGSATRWGAAVEANANGSVVTSQFSNTAVGPYTSADAFNITFNAMSAKKLLDINRGEIVVLFQLIRAKNVVDAFTAGALISKT